MPPLIYAVMGSSRDLAVGTIAVASLMTASMLGKEVNATENPTLYLHLAFTATFFAGVFQASLGILRLGFIVDYLSHATIVGFMGGAATVVSLQQLKGILGLKHFTQSTDLVSVMRSIFSQMQQVNYILYHDVKYVHFIIYYICVPAVYYFACVFHEALTDCTVNILQWRWESAVLGGIFLFYLLVARYCVSKITCDIHITYPRICVGV